MSARMSSKWSHPRDSRSPGRNRARDSRSPGKSRAWGRGSLDRGERSWRRESGSPIRSKRSRWDSPPRAHRKELDSPARPQRKYRFDSPPRSLRSELGSPTRSRRKDRWDSPPRPRRSDPNSPARSLRKEFDLSPRSRRDGIDDGFRVSHAQYLKNEGNNRTPGVWHGQAPAGLVFLCSTLTKRDCFQYGVFGLPLAQREIVERVVPGTKLFLYNFESKELFGIFEAASHGGLNLVPEAFRDFQGSYASQVRVRLYRECLPLADDYVKDVLKENLSERGKFDCELSADQVFKLLQLFSAELRSQNAAPRMGSRWDNADVPSSRNARPDAQLHLDKSDPSFLLGNKLLGESTYPDQAAGLGQGTIEEVDRLALKYLQNDPGFFVPQMNLVQREDRGNYPGMGVQSLPGGVIEDFPPRMLNSFSREGNMQHYFREAGGISNLVGLSGSGGSLPYIVNNGALLPMGMGAASTAERQVQATDEGNMAFKSVGHFLPGALRSEKGMGLLPLPGTTRNIPPQAGIGPFPFGANVSSTGGIGSLQATGNVVGSLVPSMVLPGSFLPMWSLQAVNSIPPHATNSPLVAAAGIQRSMNYFRPKKAKTKKKLNTSAATGPQKAAETQDSKEKHNQLATAEPASKNS